MLLTPLAAVYSAAGFLRIKFTTPHKLSVPVICVGNLVIGGAGKTPTTMALAKRLIAMGRRPHILSRGYGAQITSPTRVDPRHHKASDVGDEPLLLAKAAPTWVFADRVVSGKMAIDAGADILIMDDGFQNPSLYKDYSFLVVDGKQGFGNRHVLPAGPLRETIKSGMERANAIILIGKDKRHLSQEFKSPALNASIHGTNPEPKRVLAFTGLGFPDKFYGTLKHLGYEIADVRSFPDHHPYTHEEISDLIRSATRLNARLITTEKDALRISLDQYPHIDVLKIELVFDKPDQLDLILGKIAL